MPSSGLLTLLGFVFLLASSAAFSGAEVALFSLSKIQVRRLRQQYPVRGQLISDLLDHPHRLLTTILLGNVIVNTAAAILGYELIRHFGTHRAEIVAVPVMTLVLLVICNVAPKSVTIQRPERFALWLARPLRFVVTVTGWPRRAAEILSARLLHVLERLPYFAARQGRPSALTEGEYRTLLGVSERAGVLQREERVMVNRILELDKLQVREIMTPRVDVQVLEDNLTPPETGAALRRYKHRRVPVFHDSRDNIIGILNVKEFLATPNRPLAEVLDPAQMVPETMSVARLLRTFRHQEHPLAIAVDEYGGTAGLVTLEDVLEEIVGEIEDEFDSSEVMVQRLGDGRYIVNGKARLELVNEQCGLTLHADDVDTIAGWLISQLDSLPREGQVVTTPDVRATARKVAHHRVREVFLEVNHHYAMELLPPLLLIYVGLVAAGFFSGYETGLISLNRVRLHHLVERKNRRALILEQFVNHPDKLLGTALAGTNLAHVLVSVFSTALALRVFGAGYTIELLTMVVVAGVLLILCEITPKTLFRRYPHRLCLSFADLLNAAAWFLAPVVVLLGLVMRAIYALGGLKSPRASVSVTREELKHLAREGEVGGELSAEERQMILGVFDFPFKTVFEVMVPLARTVTVARDTPVKEIIAISQRTGFARFPVRDGTAIVGVVNVYEALFEPQGGNNRTATDCLRPPQLVLATERINLVLPRLRASRVPISIVVNPEGRPIGIITVEDIIEEIVGEVEG